MRLLIILLALLSMNPLFAQQNPKQQQLESYRIGFITQRLNLTADQAKTFWPVYDEFLKERKEIRKNEAMLRQTLPTSSLSDKELLVELKKIPQFKQQMADLEKEYLEKFSKVISPRQIVALYQSDHDFKLFLLKKLGNNQPNTIDE